MLKNLWSHLSKRRQKQFWLTLVLMFVASLSEVVSIGAVIPFLGVLTAPDQVFNYPILQPIIQTLELTQSNQLILPITILFIVAVLISGIIRLTLLYVMTKISFATGADLSINIYRRTLYQEYSVHVLRNSSEIINSIITKTNLVIGSVITPTLNFISSIILIIGIMGTLIVLDTAIALSSFAIFGLFYWGVIYYTKRQLKENSEIIANQSTQMVKSLQEGLGGIRDVLIDSSQQFYCELYRNADLPLRRASAGNVFISQSPRYIVESIGMVLIALLAYIITSQGEGMASVVPILGALALGAQRMLPALQQAYSAYSIIKGMKSSFRDVLNLLNQPLPKYSYQTKHAPIPFKNKIELSNLGFRYGIDTPWVLKDINLSITKGSSVGFIGATGSGKSTLLDIVMGLLPPSEGKVMIDQQIINDHNRKSWQYHIAHVPQNIYLSDGTIEENIAFGILRENIDHNRIEKVAKQAHISDFIKEWKDGYQTIVGERGVRLSGGQRQRIGIARALYKKADVLIFDEATSSLDNVTEQAIMKEIEELDGELTILIIAHRLTTLKGCDKIVEINKDKTIKILTYEEVMNLENNK